MAPLLTLTVMLGVGCYPSEHAIWTPDTLVYYPQLLGTYQNDQPAKERNTTAVMKGDADKSYRVINRNSKGEETGEGALRLVKLNGLLFYDYQPEHPKLDGSVPPLKELHIFGRLTIKDEKISLYNFGSHLAAEQLKWKTVTRGKAKVRVVANTTEDLQKILKSDADQMNVFGGSFTRLPTSRP